MPTYEYMCKQCGERLEFFQSFTDKPLRTHEDCGGDLQKVFHARGVVFKGSGFYVTDSRPKSASSNGTSQDTSSKDKDSATSNGAGAKERSSTDSSSVSDAAAD